MAIFDAIQADIGVVFGGAYLDAVLTKLVPAVSVKAHDPASPTAEPYNCKAMVDEWNASYRTGSLVHAKDVRIIILQTSLEVEPKAEDKITIRGDTYKIVSDGGSYPAVTQDPARGGWVCRGRK